MSSDHSYPKPPPPKRRKLNPKESSEEEEGEENESSISAFKNSEFVKKLDIPKELCEIIGLFSMGCIIECLYCKEEKHIDELVISNGEEYCEDICDENGDPWRHDGEKETFECPTCGKKHTCSDCEEYGGEGLQFCENCEERVCEDCMELH